MWVRCCGATIRSKRHSTVLRILFIIFLSIATLLTAAAWYTRAIQNGIMRSWETAPWLGTFYSVWNGRTVISATIVHVPRSAQKKPRIQWYGFPGNTPAPDNTIEVFSRHDYAFPGGAAAVFIIGDVSRDERYTTTVYLRFSPWLLTGGTVISWVALPPVWRRATRRLRRKRGLCVKCGYDLTGNESGVCSECGCEVTG